VVGGGNTALDAAVILRKLGVEEVTVSYRRGEEEARVYPSEMALARSLGVRFLWRTVPVAFHPAARDPGSVGEVELADTRPGRASPGGGVETVPGSERRLPAGLAVRAVGQEVPHPVLEAFGVTVRDGRAVTDPTTGATGVPGVFCGGDVANGAREVVHAVQEGKVAAAGIARFLGVE
jgi:glutamate synthase (NADPH/NADH) small chain